MTVTVARAVVALAVATASMTTGCRAGDRLWLMEHAERHSTGHRDYHQTRRQCQRRDAPWRQPLSRHRREFVTVVVERPGIGCLGLGFSDARHFGRFGVL